jgi:O-antigen/teichoic acid export membrane protein
MSSVKTSRKTLLNWIDARLARQGELGTKLVKGVVGIAGVRIFHAAVGFVTTSILARLLAPEGYGIYAYAMAIVSMLTIPSELGVPALAVRQIAVTNVNKDWNLMRGFILRAHQAIAILTLVLMIAGVAALYTWGELLDPVKRDSMALGLLLIPLVSFSALRTAMLRGLRKVLLGEIPEGVVRPLVFLGLISALMLAGRHLISPVSVMALQIAATLAAFAGGLYLFFTNRPAELPGKERSFSTSFWLKSSIPFALTAGLQLINGRTDILILGLFRDNAEIGIYRVATQVAALVVFGLRVVNAIQGPHIAHIYAQGDKKLLQKLVTSSSRAIILVSLPVATLVVLFGEFGIRIIFGAEYVSAYLPLVILCAGQLVNASTGSVASLLNMTGHERDTTKSALAAAIANIVLNVTLTPVWGMTGSAIATAATLIIWNTLMWYRVRQRIGIEASPFVRRKRNSSASR